MFYNFSLFLSIFFLIFSLNFSFNSAYAENMENLSNTYDKYNIYDNNILSDSVEDKMIRKHQSVYAKPYSFWENDVDYKLVKAQTYTVIGASLAGLGILYMLPESFTNWDKDDTSNIFSKWWNNVKDGPVTDSDDFFLNYVTHPYWGAVYYMAARSSGASAPYSFLYSAIISTFFWEYGVEAFAEVPSKQDLWITPIIGSILGEGFYLSKRHILGNNYQLLGSEALGHTAIFLMDPLSEVASWFIEEDDLKENEVALYSFPGITSSGDMSYNLSLSFKF